MADEDSTITDEEKFERELDEQIQKLDEAEAQLSTDEVTEETPESETEEQPDPESPKPEDTPEEPEKANSEPEKGGDESKEDDSEPETSKELEKPQEPMRVPIARLSEESRNRRKVERDLRSAQDQIADLQKTLESFQTQAKVQGIELNESLGFTEEDREKLAEEFGPKAAAIFIEMQQRLDAIEQPKHDPQADLLAAVEANDATNEWRTARDEGEPHMWKAFLALWEANESSLLRDFKTDAERVEHVVKLTQEQESGAPVEKPEKSEQPKPAPDKGPKRSLSNVPGDSGTGGSEIDQVLAMGDKAVDYISDLEFKDPAKYDRLMEAMSNT